jgi:RecA-family ATPase
MTAATDTPLDNASLFIDAPATAERFVTLFETLKVEVIRPPKPNWVDELGDFDDYEYPDMKWVQPGMIAEGCVTVIVAPTGHGKSFLGLKLAQTCTSPGELFGHLHQERAVLYLDRENKVRSLKERAKLLGVKIHGKANPDSKLFYSSAFLDGPREPEDKQLLEWAKQQSPPPVIIVDTLLRHLKKGMKENSSDDIATWFALFTKLLQIGCSVVVLHHTGKGESTRNGRRSLDIEGVSDFYFKLTNVTLGKKRKARLFQTDRSYQNRAYQRSYSA